MTMKGLDINSSLIKPRGIIDIKEGSINTNIKE